MTHRERITTDTLLRRISLLPAREMRRAEIRSWVTFGEASCVAEQLEELVIRCLLGDSEARLAQLTWVDFVLHENDTDELALNAIDLEAEAAGLRFASIMLADPPPHRELLGPRRNPEMRQSQPLGTRVWKASLSDRSMLEKLLLDPTPKVVERLCRNTSIREAQVINIVARRPNWPDVIDAVAKSRWLIESEQVRTAIIQNPYGRTGLAMNLLPQKSMRFLKILGFSSDIHPKLREATEILVERRKAAES